MKNRSCKKNIKEEDVEIIEETNNASDHLRDGNGNFVFKKYDSEVDFFDNEEDARHHLNDPKNKTNLRGGHKLSTALLLFAGIYVAFMYFS